MKFLFIANDFPPSRRGWGYMQLCEEVAEGLHGKGHLVEVLTRKADHPVEHAHPYPVFRVLEIEPDWEKPFGAARQFFFGRRRRENQACQFLRACVQRLEPDWIFVWHAIGIPRTLFKEAEMIRPDRVAYYLADYQLEISDEYLHYWSTPGLGMLQRWGKRALAPLALQRLAQEGKPIELQLPHVICVSEYVRTRLHQQGLIPATSIVIHNGVDSGVFTPAEPKARLDGFLRLRCLLLGRLVPEKGVHTVIHAIGQLKHTHPDAVITLDLFGDGPEPYKQQLQADITAHSLQEQIRFQAPVPRSQVPDLMEGYNVLLLPSAYDEPLARAMQEGMAMGLLVIGTVTGGSGELLVHQQTGLVFEPENPESLAGVMEYALAHPQESQAFAEAGRQAITEHFNLDRMLTEIEAYFFDHMGES